MTEAIVSGLLLGLALVFSVGPVIFTILKLRINYGISSAFYFIAGVWLSDLLWVLTANLFEIDPAQIPTSRVWMTVFDGRIVHRQ